MLKKVCIIQDISCMGKCSSTVALPVISSCGIECSLLPTALLSEHTAYPVYSCFDLTEQMKKIISDWKELSVSFDGIYTGYMLSPEQIELANEAIDLFCRPGAPVLVDPVMGDSGKPYAMLSGDYADALRALVGRADVCTPNLTECALLLDKPYTGKGYDKDYIIELIRGLRRLGCKDPVITGVSFDDERIGAAFFDGGKLRCVFSKKYEGKYFGTGDTFASVLFAQIINGRSLPQAVRKAVAVVSEAVSLCEDKYSIPFETVISKGGEK